MIKKRIISSEIIFGTNFNIEQFSKFAINAIKTDNAGGSSNNSEGVAVHTLEQLIRNKFVNYSINFITETKIDICIANGGLLDGLFKIYNKNTSILYKEIPISVTRAMCHRNNFTYDKGRQLINKKYKGLIKALNNCVSRCKNSTPVLFVCCQSINISKIIKDIWILDGYNKLNDNVTLVTQVYLDEEVNATGFVFDNKLNINI